MAVHIVVVEYRDNIWIREEIESVWSDEEKANARVREVNTDLDKWPKHVAWLLSMGLSDDAINPRHRGPYGTPGERNPAAKLTDRDVRAIRERHAAGEAKSDIARAFGISPVHCGKIISGERWKHIV